MSWIENLNWILIQDQYQVESEDSIQVIKSSQKIQFK